MNDVELCFFSALIDALEESIKKGVEVKDLNKRALSRYIAQKGDFMVQEYGLTIVERPEEDAIPPLRPYFPKTRAMCEYGICRHSVYANGFCYTHYNRQRLGRNMDAPIREPSWLKRCMTLERKQAA